MHRQPFHPIFSATKEDVMQTFFKRHLSSFFPHAKQLLDLTLSYEFKYQHNLNIFYQLSLLDRFGHQTVVKVIGKSGIVESRRVSFNLQRHLWNQGFSRLPHLINRPLAFVPRWNLHLSEELKGTLFRDALQHRSKPWIRRVNHGAAIWLKKLHSSSLKGSSLRALHQSRLFEQVFISFHQFSRQRFHEEWKTLYQLAVSLQQDLESKPAKTSQQRMIHGDFGQHNILVFPKGVGVIDFDAAALYDPAYDVASYLTQMIYGKPGLQDTRKFSPREFGSFKKAFLQTYAAGNPMIKPGDWEQRLEFYTQFFLLKISLHILTWLPGKITEKKRALQPIFKELKHRTL